ncbi:MAG: fibronectin type III domain-containing protein [Bacteroidota bacterium]
MMLSISTRWKFLFVLLNIIIVNEALAQQAQVLPGNNKYSSTSAPQGALRYQRQFYLIDSSEIARSGISSSLVINSIGFNYAVAQTVKTTGRVKVYLQNTTDAYSKWDTSWTTVSNATNTYYLSGVSAGAYDWQVSSNCTSPAGISSIAGFTINNEACKSPTHLLTQNIGTTTAKFSWMKPANAVDTFIVEWSEIDKSIWQRDTTINTYYDATGLSSNKTYKWKVTSKCARVKGVETEVFTTSSVVGSCAAPTTPVAGSVTDTTVVLKWTAATGAVQYDVWYRRKGTTDWEQTFTNADSVKITGLASGTVYQWQVRTVCGTNLEYGSFVSAASFTTTGNLRCYAPEKLYADSATSNAVKLSWDTIPGVTSYTLKYRKRESINWGSTIVPMTMVKDSVIQLPDTTGLFTIPFNYNTTFTYGGKGLYVAFEYANDSNALSSLNVAPANFQRRYFTDAQGEDSANLLLSFEMNAEQSLPGILSSSFLRPETWFGSTSTKDSAAVLAVYAMGNNALAYSNPSAISALVRNYTNADKAYDVTLKIKDAADVELLSQIKTVTVKKDSLLVVNFDSWTPAAEGKYSIIVSIPGQPGENVANNNSKVYMQNVNKSIQSYADAGDVTSFTGTDTTSGLLLARYKMNGCGAINSVQVYLGPTAVGRSVYAVIMNASGTILDSSAAITPDDLTVNRYQSFYFSSPVAITNGSDFYVGLAQPDSAGGYAPVGVQWEGGYTRTGAFYRAKINGSDLKDTLATGRLMIRAEFVAENLSPEITGNTILCPGGGSNTLSAASITRRFANNVIGFSSEGSASQFTATEALGSPDVYPQAGFNASAWMGSSSEREYLVLKFSAPDSINYIDIYQTNNPGAIDTVYVKNPATGNFDLVYNSAAAVIDAASQIKRISFPLTNFKVDEIRIALNGAPSGGHNAIDAVSIGRLDTLPSFASYQWMKKTATGATSVGTTRSIQVTTAGDYMLTVTNDGCTSSATTTVAIQNQTLPVITAGGPLRFCVGDSVTLRSNKLSGNTWSTGATTNEIVVKTSGNYSVTYNDGTGCTPLTSTNTTVAVNTYPVVTITGKLGICPAESTTLTAAATGPSVYSYSWSNGRVTTANVVNTSGVQSVTASDTVGCATTSSVVTVISPKPQPKINGLLNFCPGGSTSLTAATDFTSYAWSTAANVKAISVNAVGKYKLTVTNSFGCKGTDSVVVGQFIPPVPSITGSLSICGGSTTLNAGGGFVTYLWSNNLTTQTIKVTEPGLSTVTVIDFNGCRGSASATTVKASLPPRPGPITSVAYVCNAPSNTFNIAAVPEATHYVWFVPKGATIVSGQGTTNLKLAFDPAFVSGNLIVAASNACGQSGSMVPRLFPINATPATPADITGATTGVCSGQKTYSVPLVDGATSYAWKLPAGTSIKSGQNTNSITVTFSSALISGNICVRAVNVCGSSTEKCIAITGSPNTPGAITGLASVCAKQTNVKYSTTPVEGAKTYTWTVPDKASIISGQGTTAIFVKFASTSGNVTVKATNDCGSSSLVSKSVAVTICAITRTTSATPASEDLTAYPQLERDIISSAGNLSKTKTMQVEWTLGEPCIESISSGQRLYTQGFHQPIVVLTKKPFLVTTKLKITAAPNPVRTMLRVRFEAEKEESVVLSVRDAGGKIIFTKTVITSANGYDINMSGFSSGLYILNVQTLNGVQSENFKIVKMN